jgi:transposase
MVGRDSSYAYYDVTNYYTEIDFPNSEEDLRQRGVSKEHRLDPIIQLGLFMDQNGLPISMSLFKGNTADTKTLQPVMQEIKQHYQLNRLIVVADKGLNSTSNINYIVNNNDGYVVSQIIKGKKGQRYRNQLFDESSYIYNQDRSFKYKLFQEEYEGIDAQGKIVLRKRNVLIYWKLEDALMSIRKRDDKVNRALKSIGNNAYAIKHTYEEYIKETHLIEDTGEIADKLSKTLNQEKIENDAMYDGYFCIITSELDYDYKKIMEVYGGLWRIEESFRITKSNLEVRPIYVSKESRINGHFLICYAALIIIRMMQYKMHYSMSVERIVRALNTSKCLVEEGDIIKC